MLSLFKRNKTRSPEKRKPFSRITATYDKVPQPKGEFRNLFQEMRERSEAKRTGERQNHD